MKLVLLFLATSLSFSIAASKADEKEIHYRSITAVEGLQYEPVRIKARAGEKLRIAFTNEDPNDQPHNIVIIKPGTLQEIQAASMAVTADSMEKGFVPDSEHIIAASGLLEADGSEDLVFDMPKEKGVYYYVCTFPGHAALMYGAIYAGVSPGSLSGDPNIPEIARTAEMKRKESILNVERPGMYRIFMRDAGPAAIAVALPHEFNYCWDAGNGRLRYIWTGDFVDATGLWRSNGNGFANVLGEKIWESEAGESRHGIQFGAKAPTDYAFEGYDLENGHPVFHYTVDGRKVSETLTSSSNQISWTFSIDAPSSEVRILAPTSEMSSLSSTVGQREENWWFIPETDA
ncbi:MAG: plastocyanin/azurin family copper-binding protein [Verrucomicrobiota bacterium]